MNATPKPPIDDRLLDTAIDHFGRRGLDGASTRAIAAAAQTAMSSITYHYGGKEGLYLAAAKHIAEQVRQRFAAAMSAAKDPKGLTPAGAIEEILNLVEPFLMMLLSPQSAAWARFIVREQMEPTEAFFIMWGHFMGSVTERLVKLVMRAGDGRWPESEARVRAVALMGQVLVFRVARTTALRVTGWEEMGPAQAGEIRRVVRLHVHAILAVEGNSP
jgi:AcrR family transcriptional regulator